MKKSLILFAAVAFALTSCGNKTEGNAEGGDSTNAEAIEVAEAGDDYNDFPWDFPKSVEMEMENGQYFLSPCTFYPGAVKKKKDLTKEGLTFYYDKCTEIKDGMVNGKVPTSLCIPLPKEEKAKKGDVVLSWWQSGSGMQRALVTDDSAETPKTVYLDLSYKGDGSGFAEKYIDQLKPDSYKVLTNNKLEPGAPVAYSDGGKWKNGVCINVADDKVLISGFVSCVYSVKKSDVKVIPLVPTYKAGDNVSVVSVDSYSDGYTVKKVDMNIGRVWVERNGREEIKSILEVTNTL